MDVYGRTPAHHIIAANEGNAAAAGQYTPAELTELAKGRGH